MNGEKKSLQDEIESLVKSSVKITHTPKHTITPGPTPLAALSATPAPTPLSTPVSQTPLPTSSTIPTPLATPTPTTNTVPTVVPSTPIYSAPIATAPVPTPIPTSNTTPANAWTSVPIRVATPAPTLMQNPTSAITPTPTPTPKTIPTQSPKVTLAQAPIATQSPLPKSTQETSYTPDHPLNVLINQVDPEVRKKYVQKPLRTYEGDIAEALARKKTSVATIAIAENKKESGSEAIANVPKKSGGKNFLLLLISIVIIAAAIGGVYYVYLQSPLALPVAKEPDSKASSLIKTDFQKSVSVGNIKKSELSQKIQENLFDGNIGTDQVSELTLNKTSEGIETPITGSEFFDIFDVTAPDILKRSITDRWMLGTYDIGSEKLPFIIFTTDFFQNTFAGMLKWESSIPDELAILLNYKDKARPESVTGTTTLSSFFTILGRFEDKVVSNRDVREFISENGELLVLYSFIDKDTLVITTSETSLRNIIERIEKQTYIR